MRSRTVYSVGEAIRLQRETLNWCWDRLGKSYLRADERKSLRDEIARVLQITVAMSATDAGDFMSPSGATLRMADILGATWVPRGDPPK